ncbi:MAG: hypothetical protein QOE14_204 [Humisphaera sp.]|nr:hypothetical protein [Humisphaera sp.]
MIRSALAFTLAIVASANISLAAEPPAPAAAQQSQVPRAPRQTFSERYGLLSQRNIFLRDRSRGSSNGTTRPANGAASTQPVRRDPEETLLLRGIVIEQGEVRAYFDDIVNSRIVRVAEGDTLARGRITRIGLDAVEYAPSTAAAAGGKPTSVAIGHDLTGKAPPSSSDGAAATTGPVLPSGVEGLNPNDPNLTMEQRLKLRRMQELKK